MYRSVEAVERRSVFGEDIRVTSTKADAFESADAADRETTATAATLAVIISLECLFGIVVLVSGIMVFVRVLLIFSLLSSRMTVGC
jgi:uncharacterized membrane protein